MCLHVSKFWTMLKMLLSISNPIGTTTFSFDSPRKGDGGFNLFDLQFSYNAKGPLFLTLLIYNKILPIFSNSRAPFSLFHCANHKKFLT